MDTCSDLCDLVQEKTQSDILGFIGTMGCSALGIVEFVKLVKQADLDPIYYCEVIQLCPSKITNGCFLCYIVESSHL